jgi:HEAT repeat protein
MHNSRLATFLQIRPGEARMVALVAALFALIDASRGFGPNAVDALFFSRFGVENLPYMYIGLGLVNFVVMLAYTAGLSRFDRRRFFVGLLLVLIVMLVAERAAISLNQPALYPVLWLSIKMLSSVLGMFMWHLAGDVCDARQAKRLFSLFASAGIAGSVLGNLVTGPAANLLGTDNLLLLYAGFLMLCLLLTRTINREFYPDEDSLSVDAGFVENVRIGFNTVRGSSLLRLIAFASVLLSVLYFSISFLFSQAVAENIPDEAQIAGFLGVFTSITTGVTFLVSLFVANRLYARIGLVNAVFFQPVTYFGSFVLLAFSFSLPAAVAARFSQRVLLSGIASSAFNTFFNVVPSSKRAQVRSFNFGVPEQIGTALSGVFLILGQTVLQRQQVFVIGSIVAVLCGIFVWRMRRGYGEALLAAVKAGRFEVFDPDAHSFAGFRGDAHAVETLLQAMQDPKPSTRRLAAEMIGRIEVRSATPNIVALLSDEAVEVRRAACHVLIRLGAVEEIPAVMALRDDPDPLVRTSAMGVLFLLALDAPESIAAYQMWLFDEDAYVRVHAGWALMEAGRAEVCVPVLYPMLLDDSWNVRAHVLRALRRSSSKVPIRVEPVAEMLTDPSAAVRREASLALGVSGNDAAVEHLPEILGDSDEKVRVAAAGALWQLGKRGREQALAVLEGEDSIAQAAVLAALASQDLSDPILQEKIHAYAHKETAHLRVLRESEWSLDRHVDGGRVAKFAHDLLEEQAVATTQRLVKTLGLLSDPEAMAFVGDGLRARDAETRAAALEALETLGDRQLSKEIVPLLEQTIPDAGDSLSAAEALGYLLASSDVWAQAVAAVAAGELGLRELLDDLRNMGTARNPILYEAAWDALVRLGEDAPAGVEKPFTSVERALLLSEVPLFADLTPYDLRDVADITRVETYEDGAELAREGDEGQALFVVIEGRVRVLKHRGEADERLLATYKAGEFIGEMAIIESRAHFATSQAEGSVRVLVIGAEDFDALLQDKPEVSRALLRGISRRLRDAM